MQRLLLLTLLGVLFSNVGAMFKDQAGSTDWFRENIGRVHTAAFPKQQRGNKQHVYVATDENILASLNLRSGATVWRQVVLLFYTPVHYVWSFWFAASAGTSSWRVDRSSAEQW